ncbi:hypothetical protein VNO77_03273 [Canavalia gladiata]|uniref:Uncharacterized protein n=1 Tax=Canavalia gladiata TaxID=3824 RepID=A0AAN9MUF4_CANGL
MKVTFVKKGAAFHFCGALVLREGISYAGLEESLPLVSDVETTVGAYAKRENKLVSTSCHREESMPIVGVGTGLECAALHQTLMLQMLPLLPPSLKWNLHRVMGETP